MSRVTKVSTPNIKLEIGLLLSRVSVTLKKVDCHIPLPQVNPSRWFTLVLHLTLNH